MSTKFRAEQNVLISVDQPGTEIEIRLVVSFTVHSGCRATLVQPAEEATAEINELHFFEVKGGKPSADACTMPVWMIDRLTDCSEFNEWLLSEAADQHQAALDDRADALREEMLLARMGGQS